MRFSEFTEDKLNEVAPAVAGVVIGGVTFTAAEITAMTLGLGLSAMMLQYNADPEAFEAAHGAAAATIANSWQATKDMANSMMGGKANPIQNGKSIDDISKEATTAMTAHLTQLTPEQQAKSSEEINKYLAGIAGTTSVAGAGAAATRALTPAQRNAISAMPSITTALPNSIVSDRTAEIIAQVNKAADAQAAATAARSAEINAQVDKAADARNAVASTNAVRPDTTAAGMPAAPAAKVQQLTPAQRNAISDMPVAPNVDVDITKDIPKSDNKDVDITSDIPKSDNKDVDITSDLPDVTSPPKTRADIARGGADTAPPIVGAPPGMTLPGITGLGVGAGVAAGLNAITGAKADAIANTKTDNKKGGGRLKGKWDLPGLPNLPEPPGLGRIAPKLINLNDPLNLKRNA
jgi:hypothetical protein